MIISCITTLIQHDVGPTRIHPHKNSSINTAIFFFIILYIDIIIISTEAFNVMIEVCNFLKSSSVNQYLPSRRPLQCESARPNRRQDQINYYQNTSSSVAKWSSIAVAENPENSNAAPQVMTLSCDFTLWDPLVLSLDLEDGCMWHPVHRGLEHFPVNLEWFVGFDGTLENNPAVGGASNLLNFLSEGLEFHGDGKIV